VKHAVSLSVRDDAAQSKKFEWEERQWKQKDAGCAVFVNVNSPARMCQVSADSFGRRSGGALLLNQVTPSW